MYLGNIYIVQIVEEAGGTVSCMDGGKFCVFDRSVLVSNGVIHSKVCLSSSPGDFPLGLCFMELYYVNYSLHPEIHGS